MKTLITILLFTLLFNLKGYSQREFSLDYRVEKQAMSTPMTEVDEIFFMNYYYAKPVNVTFDGATLHLFYDNKATFTKRELTEVDSEVEKEDNRVIMETFVYTDNNNPTDTVLVILDHEVGYVQVVLPTKNSKGEYVGYTSYRQFIEKSNLALK